MLGLCRGRCEQAHCLSQHQMPICDYFLRLTCSDEHCPYLHVKHAIGSKPCEDFNRGVCKKSSSVCYLNFLTGVYGKYLLLFEEGFNLRYFKP